MLVNKPLISCTINFSHIDLVKRQMKDYEYVVVLKTIKNQLPDVINKKTFEPGHFEGRLLLYSYAGAELLGVINFEAANNSSMYSSTSDVEYAINNDYSKQIGAAIKEKIEENWMPGKIYAVGISIINK